MNLSQSRFGLTNENNVIDDQSTSKLNKQKSVSHANIIIKNMIPSSSVQDINQNNQNSKKHSISSVVFKRQTYQNNINFTLQKEIILGTQVSLQEKFESLMLLKLTSEKYELEKIVRIIIDNITMDLIINQLFIGELCSIIISNQFISLITNLESIRDKLSLRDTKHIVVKNELENTIKLGYMIKKKSDTMYNKQDKKLMKPEKFNISEKLNHIASLNNDNFKRKQDLITQDNISRPTENYNSAKNLPQLANIYPKVVSPDANLSKESNYADDLNEQEYNEFANLKYVDETVFSSYDNLKKKTIDLGNKSNRAGGAGDESCNIIDSSRSYARNDDEITQLPLKNDLPKLFDDSLSKKESRLDSMIDESLI